jgi:mRNA interferase MazF
MKQGDIWYADLNPVRGSDQKGFRPLVIVSGNLLNEYINLVICCPLTSKIKNYHGNLVLEPDRHNNLKIKSEVLTAHIRSVSKERLVRKIGKINPEELQVIKDCLSDILRY